jgi:hypothetical protein
LLAHVPPAAAAKMIAIEFARFLGWTCLAARLALCGVE